MSKVYCQRVTDVATLGIYWGPPRQCTRCNQDVIGGRDAAPEDIVCTVCLDVEVGPVATSMPTDWHPSSDPMHCSECYFRLRR